MVTIARPQEAGANTASTSAANAKDAVDVICYARDLRVAGRLDGPSGWLRGKSDQDAEVVIRNAIVRTLAGEPATMVSRVVLPSAEVVIVEADSWRAFGDMLWVTLKLEVLIEAGPYVVRGRVRGRPGTDPLARFREGGPGVTMRDALVSYPLGDVVRHRLVRELVVNRLLVESVTPITDTAEPATPRAPALQRSGS